MRLSASARSLGLAASLASFSSTPMSDSQWRAFDSRRRTASWALTFPGSSSATRFQAEIARSTSPRRSPDTGASALGRGAGLRPAAPVAVGAARPLGGRAERRLSRGQRLVAALGRLLLIQLLE